MKKLLVFSALGLAIVLTGCSIGTPKAEQGQAQLMPTNEQDAVQTAPMQNQAVTETPSTTLKTISTAPVVASAITSKPAANTFAKPAALSGDLNKSCDDQSGECCFSYMFCQGQNIQSLHDAPQDLCNCCSGTCTYWKTPDTCDQSCQKNIMNDAINGVLDGDKLSYCDKIQGSIVSNGSSQTSGDCYGWIISNNLDNKFSLCNKMSNKATIGDCYDRISFVATMNDVNINCLDIPDGYRDYCITYRATERKINELSICDYVKKQSKTTDDSFTAGICYLWVIMTNYKSDLTLCNKAKSQAAIDECIGVGANFGLHIN